MTNPNGYDSNYREEVITKDSSQTNSTSTHIDINRDFPYLVPNEKCMQTIGARLVNELYISHLFSLALTLHGGTESLTYPFGSPNHLIENSDESTSVKSTESPDYEAASSI